MLRTPLRPEESFSDDPLRMLRAARFIAGYGLEPVPELVDAVTAMHHRLSIVSAERIRDELDKLLTVDRPGAGLWFVVDTGLAEEFLPELPAMRLEQDPIHRHKDVLGHTIAVVENVRPDADASPDFDFRRTRLAALFHDVGKPKTRGYRRGKGVTFHHHEVVGARMTRDRMQALRYSNDDVEAVTRLVELHLRFHTYRMGWTDSAVRRYVRDAGDLLVELIVLTRCDCTTRNERKAALLARRMDELEARIAELAAEEELKAIRPELDGNQVMARLGSAGPRGRRGADLPARAAPRRGPARRGRGRSPPRRVVGRAVGLRSRPPDAAGAPPSASARPPAGGTEPRRIGRCRPEHCGATPELAVAERSGRSRASRDAATKTYTPSFLARMTSAAGTRAPGWPSGRGSAMTSTRKLARMTAMK